MRAGGPPLQGRVRCWRAAACHGVKPPRLLSQATESCRVRRGDPRLVETVHEGGGGGAYLRGICRRYGYTRVLMVPCCTVQLSCSPFWSRMYHRILDVVTAPWTTLHTVAFFQLFVFMAGSWHSGMLSVHRFVAI